MEVTEIEGHVKWFDPGKGYGFIVPSDGRPDVLLHMRCLRASGYQRAYEGASVKARAIHHDRGMQAVRVYDMDDTTAVPPSQRPQRTHIIVEPESDWERATVRWFNRDRGYGFLTIHPHDPDIFVHMETLRRSSMAGLIPGEIVQVRWGRGSKGYMAAELRPDNMHTS